jgi:hypothetical protein
VSVIGAAFENGETLSIQLAEKGVINKRKE